MNDLVGQVDKWVRRLVGKARGGALNREQAERNIPNKSLKPIAARWAAPA